MPGGEPGVPEEYLRDWELLQIGITPDVAAGMSAVELDWLVQIDGSIAAFRNKNKG